jgi:3-deoxy-D-manno-octulosonate 8-phosphate phosphatase (KDO 8-P phosphatase)
MKAFAHFPSINTFIFDVDGVLTNSELIVNENGELLRKMNTRDGLAIKYALNAGYRVLIITGGSSKGVSLRLKGLGVTDIYSGIENKLKVLQDYCSTHNLSPDQLLYMGDDIPDKAPMELCGTKACPVDAANEIKQIADYIAVAKGGSGCAREVIEKVMRFQSNWNY